MASPVPALVESLADASSKTVSFPYEGSREECLLSMGRDQSSSSKTASTDNRMNVRHLLKVRFTCARTYFELCNSDQIGGETTPKCQQERKAELQLK